MSKSLKRTSRELSLLVNTALASSKIRKITIEEAKKTFNLRPPLHILLRAPIGQLKSTILGSIAHEVKREVITDMTRAGLVGTLDTKTMQLIPGAAWECRNSLLLLDEFQLSKKHGGWEVFLQLLEDQRWSKRIGIFSSDNTESDGDLHMKVSRGRIDLKTRFACIAGTMKRLEYQSGQDFRAFVTRCIPYNFDINESDMIDIAQGEPLYHHEALHPPHEITIPNKAYSRMLRTTRKELSSCPYPYMRKELFMRTVGDMCRVYAAHQHNDNKMMRNIAKWKLASHMLIGKYFREESHAPH